MTPDTVFAKSPKGIEEIETRAHKLGSRLRQVLIRIDGVKTLEELVGEAGEMGGALVGQIEELAGKGFITATNAVEEPVEVAAPRTPAVPAPAEARSPATPPEAVAVARPAPPPPAADLVEFDSPVKFRLQDLLVEAMGLETGSAGAQLSRCRNREDLARWVELAVVPIEQAAGKPKAKAFYKQAKKLVGG